MPNPPEFSAPHDQPRTDEAGAYRAMAASCRKMAAVSRRPGPLLLRAEAYEACALEAERGRRRP